MTSKPRTYQGDLAHLPPALQPLTEERRWVVWNWELRKNKWTKPPYRACNPSRYAHSDDPGTWECHAAAVDAVAHGAADGIGFALLGSNIGAVDLDHCRDAESGAITPWAENIRIEAGNAYCEVTVSGQGLRIIGRASGPEMHRKFTFDRATGAGIELYRNTARYITVSGLEIGSCVELPDDGLLDNLNSRHGRPPDGLDFNAADQQQSSIDYDALIQNGAPEGQRSELFQACFNEAEDALILLDREIYQRGGLVVRPVLTKLKAADDRDMQGWRLIAVTQPHLVEVLTCAARFLKYDGRSRAWAPINAPEQVAQTYLARQGAWKLPILSGIVHTPFLRADGSLCERPGYDPASGLLFKPDKESFPPVPRVPSKDDALAALTVLEQPIATFPFVGEADRAVALSAILTALDRRAMATAPLPKLSLSKSSISACWA
jgi:hypothetical protein